MSLPDRTTVRGYTLTYLASGGMSSVYRGEKGGQSFILKSVPADQPGLVLALTQEKGLLERLQHPRIVRFVSLFEERGAYYLVLEFIQGRTLDELAREQRITEGQARAWGIQLCDTLEYLHSQQPPIIYRDLKPSNVMLAEDGIRMIDFGIARLHKGTRSEDTEALGSFLTASPEHFGSAETDARSDVYSLGATLHDLLSGPDYHIPAPFQFEPIRKLNPEVSAELEAVLARATAMNPADRYQTMAEMRAALGGAVAEPVREAAPVEPPRATERRPYRGKVGAALVLVALLLLSGFLWPRTPFGHEDPGLVGDVFGVRPDGDAAVVTLGEDVGLFRVRKAFGVGAEKRARIIADRMNKLYHQQCPSCGAFKLEPQGFRIARYTDKEAGIDEVALFYSHADEGQFRAPLLLAILDRKEAERLGTTPKFAAGYWRNLTRELIALSRGKSQPDSILGGALEKELLVARKKMAPGATVQNLNAVLEEISSERAQALESMFERVPRSFRCQVDRFEPVGKYAPLKG